MIGHQSYMGESTLPHSDAFEQDMQELNGKIGKLETELTKSITDVAKSVEAKYRDFVPHFLTADDCQDKIKHSLDNGKESLQQLEVKVQLLEKKLARSMDAPSKKLAVVRAFIHRLNSLNEIEMRLSSMWLPETGAGPDNLHNAVLIIELEGLLDSLAKEETSLETIKDRILPLLHAQCCERKSELLMDLEQFYKSFVRFPDVERISPGMLEMVLDCKNPKLVSDNLTALKKLGHISDRLDGLVDALWKLFCVKIIHSASPDTLTAFHSNDGVFSMSIQKSVPTVPSPCPSHVISALRNFFAQLHRAIQHIQVDGVPLATCIGEKICARLISAIVEHCFMPAIPVDKKDPDIRNTFSDLCTSFNRSMKDDEFFTETTLTFEEFFDSFERIYVDRRCHHFISTARQQVTQPYIDLTKVGCATDEKEEVVGEISKKMREKEREKGQTTGTDTLKSTTSDKFSPKLFQFQKSTISTSTFKFVHLLHDALKAVAEADSELEARRLLTTAKNMVKIYIDLSPAHHQQALATVPLIAAVFFNNCHYLCHRLTTIQTDLLQPIAKKTKLRVDDCNFAHFFVDLRSMATHTLEQHLTQIRMQISTTIGDRDIFQSLKDDSNYKQCEKAINSCVMQITQIEKVWSEVLSKSVLAHCMTVLVSHLLTIMSGIVLAKEDIAAGDAEIMVSLLGALVQKLEKVLTFDGEPTIHKTCEGSYFRMKETIFCLDASLMEIGNRWCEGKGPLATWLEPAQVKQLVRALFQNTDRRAQLLSQIN